MTTAGADADLKLPDVAGALKRDWPRVAVRAIVAVLVPLFTTLLIHAFDLLAQLQAVVPTISFLQPELAGYDLRVVAFLVLVLVLGAYVVPRRSGQILLGLSALVIVAVGFNHSQLRWTTLFEEGLSAYLDGQPPALAWTWAVLLLATVITFILVEEVLDTRRHQAARDLPDEQTRAVQHVARQGVILALVGGGIVLGGVLGLGALLSPLVTGQDVLPRLNPVYVLFALGVLLVLAVIFATRRSRADVPVASDVAPPAPPPGYVRVPVKEGGAPRASPAPREPR